MSSARSCGPVKHHTMTHALRPHSGSGNGGAGGIVSNASQPDSSSGRAGASSRYQRMTSGASAMS